MYEPNLEPNVRPAAIPARSSFRTKTIVSLAMLSAVAYVVMCLSKLMPSVYGFLDFRHHRHTLHCGGLCGDDHHQPHRPLGLPDERPGHLRLLLHRFLHL